MSLKLNLVVEKPDVEDEFEYIEEEVDRNSPSNLYIKFSNNDERINILLGEVTNISEGQESSEVNYQEGKEAS